jgi:tripartite-type tricarboxylate transporter receptor subunit TctC
LPPAIVSKVNAAVNHVTAEPDVLQRFAQDGIEPIPMSPDELLNFYREETRRWVPLARAALAPKK